MSRTDDNPYGDSLQDQINSTLSGTPSTSSYDPVAYKTIGDAYSSYLGRQGSEAEILAQLGGGSFRSGDPRIQLSTQNIYNSPEAVAYRARSTATPAAPKDAPKAAGSSSVRDLITKGFQEAHGRLPTEADYAYWESKWPELTARGQELGDPDYAYKRLLGLGAGGADVSKYGPYANGSGNTLSYRGDLANFSQFDDPAASLLERLSLDRVNRLSETPQRPNLDAYVASLLEKEKQQQQRAQEFAQTIRARAESLKGPAFSDQDEDVLRAKAFDQLERRRTQTLKNQREGIYARGFAPTSGLAQDSDNRVNDAFEQARTGIASDLLQYMIQEQQARKDKALQLEGIAQQALNGGDITSLQYQSQIADLEDSLIGKASDQERERLAAAGIPYDLANNRTQLALQILGQGGNPSSLLQSILGISQYGQNSRAMDVANRNSNLAGLGSLGSLLIEALSKFGKH